MSVGAWDLGKEMLENGENHDNNGQDVHMCNTELCSLLG